MKDVLLQTRVICTFSHEIIISMEPRVTILGGNTNIISITKIDIGHHIFIQNRSRYITEKDIYTLSNIEE